MKNLTKDHILEDKLIEDKRYFYDQLNRERKDKAISLLMDRLGVNFDAWYIDDEEFFQIIEIDLMNVI